MLANASSRRLKKNNGTVFGVTYKDVPGPRATSSGRRRRPGSTCTTTACKLAPKYGTSAAARDVRDRPRGQGRRPVARADRPAVHGRGARPRGGADEPTVPPDRPARRARPRPGARPRRALAAPPGRRSTTSRTRSCATTCGVPLNIAESPRAEQERAEIRRLIAQGRTKQQIKAALVAQYGPDVLADAARTAASRGAWLVPDRGVALAALGALAFALRAGGATARPPARSSDDRAPRALAADARRGSTRTSRRYDRLMASPPRPRPRDGLRRLRGRLRVVRLAVRAAARARLPVGRVGVIDRRHARGPGKAAMLGRRRSSACRSRSCSSRSACRRPRSARRCATPSRRSTARRGSSSSRWACSSCSRRS